MVFHFPSPPITVLLSLLLLLSLRTFIICNV
nr:MAG TPA: hypothetical protein [Caudoviricetes sp.]